MAKSESFTKVDTEVTKTEVETISAYKEANIDTYEVEVIAKDSLQPITVNLNGVAQTFSGASKIILRKKKEAVREQETKSVEFNEKRTESVKEKKEEVKKDISKSGIRFLIPLVILLGVGYLLYRISIKRFVI